MSEYISIRFEAFGACNGEIKLHTGGCLDQRVAYIIAVPDEGNPEPLYPSLSFLHGHDIRKGLTGVMFIAQPVDDRDGRCPGKFLDPGVYGCSYNDAAQIS